MNKLPKFAIRVQVGGNAYGAFFKPTGVSNEVKVSLTFRGKTLHTYKANLPKHEILSWSQFVNSTVPKELKNERPATPLHLPGAVPLQEDNPKPTSDALLLPKVRGTKASKGVVFARDAEPNQLYKTTHRDPAKSYLCRYVGTGKKDHVVLHIYFPAPLAEWKDVEVPETYLLKHHDAQEKENTKMTKKEVPTANAPTATSKAGLGVYEAWGKAFEANGTKVNAPELIVAFMEKQFPGRKTKWAKWVNAVRARYNAGKLPGVRAPKEKIASYSFKKSPSRTAERRKKPERRTPPLKSVRSKKSEEPEAVA